MTQPRLATRLRDQRPHKVEMVFIEKHVLEETRSVLTERHAVKTRSLVLMHDNIDKNAGEYNSAQKRMNGRDQLAIYLVGGHRRQTRQNMNHHPQHARHDKEKETTRLSARLARTNRLVEKIDESKGPLQRQRQTTTAQRRGQVLVKQEEITS